MSHLKELKTNIKLILSSTSGATRKISRLSFCFTHTLNLYIFSQLLHTLLFCSTLSLSLSSTFHHLPQLIQRSNHISLKIDSCWHGFDCVTNVMPVSFSSYLFQQHKYIRVGSNTFVPTTCKVICVGNKPTAPIQPLPQCFVLFFYRSNRKRAIRVVFSTVISSDSC